MNLMFTPEELAELAAFDAEIDADDLTLDEYAESQRRDKQARFAAKDKQGQKLADYQRAYYEANKEKVADYQRAYREANKEKVRRKNREYMREYRRRKKEQQYADGVPDCAGH